MKKQAWKNKIIKACEDAGTYREFFVPAIDTLAGILEKRDEALDVFEKTGGNVIVKHTNKNGATNFEQHPALRLVNDLNRDALAYWRDLGLTPAGLKRIDENRMKGQQNKMSLEDVLAGLGI